MENIYINSKGEEVKISEMLTPHLLYSIAKNSRLIGSRGSSIDRRERREAEVKGMHHEVMKRFAELSEEAKK